MWARGTPKPDASSSFRIDSNMSAIITKEITSCETLPELETVFDEYAGSFCYINASAALVKYAKLRGSNIRSPFFSKLATIYLNRLPDSDIWGCTNVLWACSKLGSAQHPVWTSTWQAFLEHVEKGLGEEKRPCLQPQQLSNVLYACAKLRQQPQPDELLLLLEAFAHPVVLSAAKPQEIANVIWSLGLLSIAPDWQATGVSKELLQRLLAPELLVAVVSEGVPQAVSNVLVGLGRMCTGPSPLLSTAAAQQYAGQLLSGVRLNRLSTWAPQHISNAMWALGELQLKGEEFVQAAAAAAPVWLPKSTTFDLNQAATACAQLQYQDERFIGLLVQRGQQLLQLDSSRRSKGRPVSEADRDSVAAMCCLSVVLLDMRGLAGAARKLVVDSNIKQHSRTHPSNMRRLWVFHNWLLDHQLLDGKGLAGLLTQQQLQQGGKEAAAWGDKTRL